MFNCCNKNYLVILFLSGIFFFCSQPSFAQEMKQHVALEDLIREVLANNRELQAAREELQAARHRVPQSSALPDPVLGYAIMGPDLETRLGPQRGIYEFEQMVPFPGKLIEKRGMAAAEVEAASARFKLVERDVIFRVSEVYYDLYTLDATLQVVEEVKQVLKNFESIASARYSSQKGEQRDVAKAQVEVSETLEKIYMLNQQRESLVAMLNALLNRRPPGSFAGFRSSELPVLSLSLSDLLQKARENRPELLEAMAMRKREQHAKTLAKYEYAPDISIGFQYTKIGEGMTSEPDDGKDAWMIPLKFTFPLWQNRIVPVIQEAKSNLKASEAKLEQTENFTDYEIKNAYYRFTSAKKIIELYQNALIPEAELAFRSDQAGYEGGKTDILNLIDSERVYLNAKIVYYQVLAETLKNFAAIERITGMGLLKENDNKSPQGVGEEGVGHEEK